MYGKPDNDSGLLWRLKKPDETILLDTDSVLLLLEESHQAKRLH